MAAIGNQNAAKGRRWHDALHKALVRYETDKIKAGEALDKIAQTVVEKALAGDRESIQEIGNRLDGKPHQSTELTGANGGPLEIAWPIPKTPLDQA